MMSVTFLLVLLTSLVHSENGRCRTVSSVVVEVNYRQKTWKRFVYCVFHSSVSCLSRSSQEVVLEICERSSPWYGGHSIGFWVKLFPKKVLHPSLSRVKSTARCCWYRFVRLVELCPHVSCGVD